MSKAKPGRVKRLTIDLKGFLTPSVNRITRYRVADMLKMNPNLVGSSRMKLDPH